MLTITENLSALVVILTFIAFGAIVLPQLIQASTTKKKTDAELASQPAVETSDSGLVLVHNADISTIENDAVLFHESVPAFIQKMVA